MQATAASATGSRARTAKPPPGAGPASTLAPVQTDALAHAHDAVTAADGPELVLGGPAPSSIDLQDDLPGS